MPITCPKCGSTQVIKIIYGYPGRDLGDAEERGEIKLGGCCISDDNPTHYCKDCKSEFRLDKQKTP